jgi:hypothetical protein
MFTSGNIRIYNHKHNSNISKSCLEGRNRHVPQIKNLQMDMFRKTLVTLINHHVISVGKKAC